MASPRIRPIRDMVLVKADEAPSQSDGGILFADASRTNERPKLGTVVSVGPGHLNPSTGTRTPLEVKPGDRVCLSKFTWQFDFDDTKYSHPEFSGHVLVREQDLVAVVEDGSYAA